MEGEVMIHWTTNWTTVDLMKAFKDELHDAVEKAYHEGYEDCLESCGDDGYKGDGPAAGWEHSVANCVLEE
jgi:hypothetical protein